MPINIPRLRRQNVLQGYQLPDMGPVSPFVGLPEYIEEPEATLEPDYDMAGRMRQLYQPETVAQERLTSLVNQFPIRKEPGALRKIGASMIGLRNVGKKNQNAADAAFTTQLQDRFMDKPFYQGVEDWRTQVEPVLKAADIERAGNVNERGFANQIISQELAERKQTEVERKNKEQQKIQQQRADIYGLKARMPNWKFDFSGPTVMMVNPATGEARSTGIATGNLSDTDRINLQGEWGVAREEAATNRALALEGARQPNRLEVIEAGGEQARETKQTPAAAADNALNIARDRYNRARELADTVPGAKKWLKFGNNGQVELLAPTMLTSMKERELHRKLQQELYKLPPKSTPQGNPNQNFRVDLPGQKPPAQAPAQAQGQVLRRSVTNKQTGEKRIVVSTDGGKTWDFEK